MEGKKFQYISHGTFLFNPRTHLDVKPFFLNLLGIAQSPQLEASNRPGLQAVDSSALVLNCFSLVDSTPLNHVLKPFLSVLKVHQSLFSASCGVETPGVPRSSVGTVFLDALQHPLASPGGCQPISSCFWLGG